MSYEKFWADELRGGWDFGAQARRDEAARRALHLARNGWDRLPFCLYLRPFESVNRMPAQTAAFSLDSLSSHVDFETVLRKAVETLNRAWSAFASEPLQLVAPGEYDALILGAGLAQASEDEWREAFTALAGAVKLIVVVPSVRPGTMWELSQIVDKNLWRKTLFVMPESVHSREAQAEAAKLWQQATGATRGMGIALPAYDKNGAVFRLGDDGRLVGTRPLRLTQRLRRVSYLRRAILDLRAI